MEDAMKKIGEMVREARADEDGLAEAITRERVAEVQLLDLVVRTVAPALSLLTSRVEVDRSGAKVEYASWEAVLVAGGPHRKEGGTIDGTALFLDADAVFQGASYSGLWTRDGREEWTMPWSGSLTTEQVLAKWSVDEVVRALAERLRQQVDGKKAKRAEQANRIADRFEAIATLLGGGG